MNKAKHAFGSSSQILAALESKKINARDVLFLDENTPNPKVGWIDKQGNPVIVDTEKVVSVDSLPESGEEGKVYIFNDEGYFWNGEKFVNFCKPTDLTELEDELATKANAEEVNVKINQMASDSVATANTYTDEKLEVAMAEHLVKKYEVSSKPLGTLVDYREKEIRVMCPADTQWVLQQSGENADANKYYFGLKAYAPKEANSFKETIGEIITDDTMYYFENNDFAGVDSYGRKYSIIWLPAAVYSEETSTWTYYGASSTTEHFVGWHYSVEWYDNDGVKIASDCIKINLSNEDCHFVVEPYYIAEISKEIDTKIEEKIAEVETAYEIVEF